MIYSFTKIRKQEDGSGGQYENIAEVLRSKENNTNCLPIFINDLSGAELAARRQQQLPGSKRQADSRLAVCCLRGCRILGI